MNKGGGRKEWGYAQMIRFWTTGIWKHAAVQEFETIMRIDANFCFIEGDFTAGNDGGGIEDDFLPVIRVQYVYRNDALGIICRYVYGSERDSTPQSGIVEACRRHLG
jgi:hypothetical protein